ncbi:D-tyrosyl-tRNA(Tyr) deacylase [Eubacterium sp. AF15-50]|uniref:D-aminoacyl-tRNA deacylase n=1 Tax=Eubacterium segne TaxID=2763045 RepID=A0ABR7F0V9_9FIRM|nr:MULTISPECIES: D-aminoacyl-tRNA deacylase [unclassified Eubacterium (in: firmicutes)]MBC5666882.1 D-tyrosyl-tRNA(Tyr) deacylase [Eubacterium segne]RHR74138.1 D-tyrosyl-tRNA(Tyr) deacylase [Eubacterium sp. AF16-48]RHR81672.1 D-tyrosyl-tRNA(Tyr) deacylase [Eubacterium sp. AF15-50]
MKFLIQRVTDANVSVDGKVVGKIGKGFMVFIGIAGTDTVEIADKMIKKLIGMRIFEDENGKTNLALKDVGGELLLISQFTLYSDCKKGNRPSFVNAGAPDMADEMYQYIISQCKKEIDVVEKGIFGADMKVSLVNDGPFTIVLDSDEIIKNK